MKKLLIFLAFGSTISLSAQSIPSNVPTIGLLVWYPLDTLGINNPAPDGNSSIGRDLSGNSQHWSAGQHYISRTDRHGNIGGAISSDTSTLETPFVGVLGQGSRTVSLWVKSKYSQLSGYSLSSGYSIFAYGAQTAGNRYSGHLDFNCQGFGIGSAYSTITNAFTIDTNWHHVVYVFDSTNCNSNCSVDDVIIYVDGQVTSTCNTFSPNTNINTISSFPLRLYFGAASMPDSLRPAIDDFGMWDRPLSFSEVTNLYNSQNIPSYVPTDSLVGWWPFNGNVNDYSGNGHNGIPTNVTYDTSRFGNLNSALKITGNGFVELPTLASVNIENHTFSAWYKTTDSSLHYSMSQQFHWNLLFCKD